MIGDYSRVKLQKALTTTATDSAIANSAGYETIITYIALTFSSGSTKRTVTVYVGGTASSNIVGTFDIDPTGNLAPKTIVLDNQAIVLQNTESIYFKQDTGTDINVLCCGKKEQIA